MSQDLLLTTAEVDWIFKDLFIPPSSEDADSKSNTEAQARSKERSRNARSIRRRLKEITPANSNEQRQSPLYSVLPPEIRNHIFELALGQYDDPDQPYPENAFYYRPYLRGRPRIDHDLLRTCRRVYYETAPLPMLNATHYIFYGDDRGPGPGPPDRSATSRRKWRLRRDGEEVSFGRMETWTRRNYNDLNHVQFFLNQYSLRCGHANSLLRQENFCPRRITVTIRHTDWDNWQHDADLKMDIAWKGSLFLPCSCRVFEMELETIERKKGQLDCIIQELAQETLNVCCSLEGDFFSCRTEPRISSWEGKADFGGHSWSRPHGDAETLSYHVATLTWKRFPAKLWDLLCPGVERGEVDVERLALTLQ